MYVLNIMGAGEHPNMPCTHGLPFVMRPSTALQLLSKTVPGMHAVRLMRKCHGAQSHQSVQLFTPLPIFWRLPMPKVDPWHIASEVGAAVAKTSRAYLWRFAGVLAMGIRSGVGNR